MLNRFLVSFESLVLAVAFFGDFRDGSSSAEGYEHLEPEYRPLKMSLGAYALFSFSSSLI